MVGDQNPGDRVARAPTGVAAPVAEGVEGKSVVRRFLSLKQLMAGRRLRGGGGGEGGRGQYRGTFEEEHSCKQPLLVKVCPRVAGVGSESVNVGLVSEDQPRREDASGRQKSMSPRIG